MLSLARGLLSVPGVFCRWLYKGCGRKTENGFRTCLIVEAQK